MYFMFINGTNKAGRAETRQNIDLGEVRTDPAMRDLRSHRAEEIMSEKQGFLTQWAVPIFLVILLSVIGSTWFIRYPDIIHANAILTAANAPKEIVSRQEGKLIRLFVSNNDTVSEGQMIAWIETTARHQEVIALSAVLEKALRSIAKGEYQQVSVLFQTSFHDLGELQSVYQQFVLALQPYNDCLINGYYDKRERVLSNDYAYLLKTHQYLDEQQQLLKQDLELESESFAANSSLFRDSVISSQDLRDRKSKLVGKQINLPQIQTSLLTNENQQINKQKEIGELEHTVSQQKINFQQALLTLYNAVNDWKKKYIITAPTDGKVVFIVPLQVNQFMQAAKIVGYINPADSRYYAQVILPQNNFGKISRGMAVQLRFDAYPYQEFGVVSGNLQYISDIPTDSGFLATVTLPHGLTTNYNKHIQYKSGLRSQASIITRDVRLLQRFYYDVVRASK